MADLQQLEEQIVGLSLLDAAALVKKLEERLGVSAAAAAPVMVAGGGGAAAAAPAVRGTSLQRGPREAGSTPTTSELRRLDDGARRAPSVRAPQFRQ